MTANEQITFRSTTSFIVWVIWLLFAAANWIDLAVQGRDRESVIAAAVLLLATGIAYVTAQRPRILADDAGITVRNPLRDHRIGWAGVDRIDLAELLRVHCDWGASHDPDASPDGKKHRKVISAWAVHYSRRRQLAAQVKARRAAQRGGFGLPPLGGGGRTTQDASTGYAAAASASAEEAEAERAVRLLSERATAIKAEMVWANGTADPEGEEDREAMQSEPPKSTWSGPAIAAILVPALILLAVSLI